MKFILMIYKIIELKSGGKIIMKTIFTILALLTAIETAPAQVTQEWIARYNSPGNSNDRATSIAVDGSGNIYVTGTSRDSGTGDDYATIKYNSSGVQQWVRKYNGSGDSTDQATSIAVDGSDNVYVTGSSTGLGTSYDYATIKYNSAGTQIWVARYNGPGNGNDFAYSIVVDNSGNVYVTGGSLGNVTSYLEYATVKYNSAGVQLWVGRYSSTSNFGAVAKSIALDDQGNVYVTGFSYASGSDYDFATVKYNPVGAQQWAVRYNGTGNYTDYANSIAVDGTGNVYITGESSASGLGSADYTTIKYNSSGIQQWISRLSEGSGQSIAVNDSGNVYVTGTFYGDTGNVLDYGTIKYNSNGEQLWFASYNGPGNIGDYGKSLALDKSGNVYVTGSSYVFGTSGSSNNYATIKYNSQGIQQWAAVYNGPGNYYDGATSIAVDSSGYLYVTGYSTGSGTGYDYATIKYSQSTGIAQTSSEIPDQYSLSQNYPNPFNPVTNLEFGISDLGFVSLKVYDILGKEIITLVNEKLSPGNYKVEFDGSGLTSGVYFYRLTVGEFTDTKRMMLVK